MFANTRRRIIAACASALLVLGIFTVASAPAQATTTGTISAKVTDQDGHGLDHIKVTVFELVGGTWTDIEAGQRTLEGTAKHPELAGTYTLTLDPGTYRAAFDLGLNNEIEGGGEYFGQYFPDTTTPDAATSIVVSTGSTHPSTDATLHDTGGTISGTVLDVAGKPLGFAEVEGYNIDSARGEDTAAYDSDFSTTTDASGNYTLRTRGEPFKVHFLQDSGGYLAKWYDSPTYADAATLSADAGQAVNIDPVTLDPLPLANTMLPRVSGDLFVGGTAHASEGDWSSHDATYAYQWYRVLSSGSEIKLWNGIHQTYKLNSHDKGHQLRVVVTASQAGTPDLAVESGKSATAKLGSKISFSTSSSSRGEVMTHATVWKSTGSHASGKIRFSCGNSLVTFARRTMTLKSGRASTTLKYVPKGTVTCTAKYYGTSTVASKVKTDRVTVK